MGLVWRFLATRGLDVLIVLAALESAIYTALRTDPDRPSGAMLWLEMLVAAGLVLVLLARRRFPFAAPAALWIGCGVASFLDHQMISSQAGIFVAGLGAAVLLGSLRSGVQARAGLLIVLVSAAVVVYNVPGHDPADLVFTPLIFVVGWLVGYALRDRNQQAEAAEERAQRAELERESAARLAVAEERARMARELHDVVAHAVSVMVLQVGAVRHRLPAGSEEGEALRNVERAGRSALAEMRRLLGALREGDDLLELTPHPGLDHLETLAGDVRAAGLDVRIHTDGEPVPLPPSLDLSAYRIVQEGLTNALKHSGARRADVTVDYAPGELRLEVRDDGRGGHGQKDGAGHGLIGIGERVKTYGGDMSAFVATSGGFVLRASLPLEGEA
ncbi:MAG: sensor histidine kinase [Nocardioides sp.]|nr:sensor histidine kinase [Nocardioidaceae bacterium]MCB8958145.1 sensor histidine kinase [Nocardioides sp.]